MKFNFLKLNEMKRLLLASVCTLMLVSCVQNSAEYKKLQAENESLKLENTKSTAEINEMLDILNEVEADFQSIRDAENYLSNQQQPGGELSSSSRERIRQNMTLITETLVKNKEQIALLEERLKNSGIQSTALRRTIDRLTAEVEQKTMMIAVLQEDLAKKDVRIQELDNVVASLSENVEELASASAAQTDRINAQDKALHTAYYCFGTTKELKEQKIISGGGLFSKSKVLQSGFNQDYFIPIDIREVTEVPLFSNKATIKSNHPKGSYELVKGADGNMIFRIIDMTSFWSLGRFLVLEVG